MAKYLLVYHGGEMAETDAERSEQFAAWGKWFGDLGPAIVDGGNPVARTSTIDGTGVHDGSSSNPATGYSVLEAATMEAAVQMAKGCPVLQSGGTIEVCETFNAM